MSNQLQITGGAKVRNLNGVITGTTGVLGSVPLGAANGVATLDSGGKVPVSQLPSSVVTYLGTWNAATNTPTLVNGTGDAGDLYICNVAGTVNFGAGPISFVVGDWVLYGSGTWQKSSGQNGTVTSVAVTETGDALTITGSPITTAGTINIGFAGTSAQYVAGDGTLITFPSLTGYVPYTGATSDVDLGTHVLNAQALHVKGTAGAGHLGLKHQTAAPTGSANESLIFADVNGNLGWQNNNLYLSTFVSNANTDNRTYTLQNASGTLAFLSDIPSLAGYVTLATTQTISGEKTFSGALITSNGYGITLEGTGTSGNMINFKSYSSLGARGFGYSSIGVENTTKFIFYSPIDISTNSKRFYFELSGLTTNVARTYTMPDANGTLALTSDIPSLSATAPISYSGGVISISQATTSTNGYLSSTDWNTFNGKQSTITLTTTGTSGAATLIGSTLNIPDYTTDLSGYVTLATTQTISGTKTFSSDVFALVGVFTRNSADTFIGTSNNTSGIKVNGTTLETKIVSGGNETATFASTGAATFSSSVTAGVITSSVATGNGSFYINNASLTNKNWTLIPNTNGTETDLLLFYTGTGAGTKLTIASSGAATFSSSVTASTLTANGGYSYFYGLRISGNDTGNTIYAGNANIGITADSGNRIFIGQVGSSTVGLNVNTTNGNVGIGTSGPTAKLVVSNGGALGYEIDPASTSGTVVSLFSYDRSAAAWRTTRYSSLEHIFESNGTTERMRITSGGSVLIGTTSNLQSNEKLGISSDSNTAIIAKFTGGAENGWAGKFWNNGTSGNNLLIEFLTESSLTARGSITYNRGSGVVAYNTTSDYRLKTEITDFNAIDIVLNLKPKEFRINDSARKSIGFIAHELQEYYPQAVSGEKDAIDKDGNPIYQGVDYSQLTGLLVKAIQELKAEINELKNK